MVSSISSSAVSEMYTCSQIARHGIDGWGIARVMFVPSRELLFEACHALQSEHKAEAQCPCHHPLRVSRAEDALCIRIQCTNRKTASVQPKATGRPPSALRISQPSPASYCRLVGRMTRMQGWRRASLSVDIWDRNIDDADRKCNSYCKHQGQPLSLGCVPKFAGRTL